MPRLRKILDSLGLKQNILALLSMVILVGLGEKMAERFLPVYLLALGGGVLSVGLLGGLDNLLSALYSFPGGYLSDRFGYKRALILFNLMAMFGYTLVILFPHWLAVIAGAVFFLSWTAISLPATMSLVARVLPRDKRTMGVSMHSLVRRIPMALGPILGGGLISLYGEKDGVRLAFVAAWGLALVALVLQQVFITEERVPAPAPLSPVRLLGLMSPPLRRLLAADILVRFCEQIPYAFVVVWCLKVVGITPVQFGVLTAVEMAVAMLVYIPVAYLADRGSKKPFVAITFGFFTLFPPALYWARSFPLLLGAFVIRGLKEFGEPTRKALIMDLAPEERKAGMFGLYYLLRDVIVSLAAFGGAFLWAVSPGTNFLSAFLCGLAGTVLFSLAGRDLRRERAEASSAGPRAGPT